MSTPLQKLSRISYQIFRNCVRQTTLVTMTLIIWSWTSLAAAEVTPGQDLEPLDFNTIFISDIAESRTGSGALSDTLSGLLGQIGGEILKDQLSSDAICSRATVQSSHREVKVEIECAVDDGTQLTVAAYSETDKATLNVTPVKVVLRGGQAEAILAISSSAGLSFEATSKFLVVNKGGRTKFELNGSSASLFSMVHKFSHGARVRPEPEAGANFRRFSSRGPGGNIVRPHKPVVLTAPKTMQMHTAVLATPKNSTTTLHTATVSRPVVSAAPKANVASPAYLPTYTLMAFYAAPGDGGPSLNNRVSFAIDTGDVGGVNTDAALPFFHEVWRDTHDTGVYYYAPKQFSLSYGEVNDGKLGIDVLYGNDSAAEKPITLTLHFDTGIDESDVSDLRRLMQSILATEGRSQDIELKRFPVSQDPTVSFELFTDSGEPHVLKLDNDRFSTLSLQWSLTETVWQQWLVSLRDQNHSGGLMTLTPPDSNNQPSHGIDIIAQATDPAVYGQDAPDDLGSWTNNTPFPVTLRRLHGLGTLDKKPASVSWTLHDTKLMPGEQVIFDTDTTNFPTILKQRLVKYWLDYRLDTACESCVDSAIPTQAVSAPLGRNITFKLPNSYDSSAYEEIQVIVRSRFLTPQANNVNTSAMIVLSASGQEEAISTPLYLPDGLQLSEGGLAEAKITVITSGGERTVSGPWLDLTNERTYISPSKIQSVLDANP